MLAQQASGQRVSGQIASSRLGGSVAGKQGNKGARCGAGLGVGPPSLSFLKARPGPRIMELIFLKSSPGEGGEGWGGGRTPPPAHLDQSAD